MISSRCIDMNALKPIGHPVMAEKEKERGIMNIVDQNSKSKQSLPNLSPSPSSFFGSNTFSKNRFVLNGTTAKVWHNLEEVLSMTKGRREMEVLQKVHRMGYIYQGKDHE